MNINKTWHLANRMPNNPTLDQRVVWYLAHAKNCSCRPLGGKILEEIKKRGLHETKEWNELFDFGKKQVRKVGIRSDADVNRVVASYRKKG